jgi:hypothetical protein
MGLKNQINMFFCMIILYTCDLHLKLEILNLNEYETSQMI